jgi:hypothetical protein
MLTIPTSVTVEHFQNISSYLLSKTKRGPVRKILLCASKA